MEESGQGADEKLMEGEEPGYPLPSGAAAVELRTALVEEQEAKDRIAVGDPSVLELQEAARDYAVAHFRVKAARARVAIEVGAVELPLLEDRRPRFGWERRG